MRRAWEYLPTAMTGPGGPSINLGILGWVKDTLTMFLCRVSKVVAEECEQWHTELSWSMWTCESSEEGSGRGSAAKCG